MKLLLTAVILLFCTCKISDTNLLGQYAAKSYHRSTIILDSNNQFRSWNDGYDLLLSNESFLGTQGSWTRVRQIRLFLNSISDSITIPRFSIAKQKLHSSNKSKFVFIDLNKDTVLMGSVYRNNRNVFYKSHGPFLTSFEDSLAIFDTLTFNFTWGFKPIRIPIDSNEPTEYTITLNREFRPAYFRNAEFIIRRNKLIKVTDKTKFGKTKKQRYTTLKTTL